MAAANLSLVILPVVAYLLAGWVIARCLIEQSPGENLAIF